MKKQKKTLMIVVLVLICIFLALLVSGLICNKNLRLNTFTIKSDNLPDSFNGYKIIHISDLHNATFGKDNEKLINMIADAEPDIIAITGDVVDCRRTDTQVALDFIKKAVEIAPCYYVAGNHEARVPANFQILLDGFEEAGVTILRNQTIPLTRGDNSISLTGVDDPDFTVMSYSDVQYYIMDSTLQGLISADDDSFRILLSHRPEMLNVYTKYNIDLTLSGHAHGGQFRLPFVGGLYAPHQGLLPEYDSGLYTEGSSNLIVSRGIGNSLFPLRLFNSPEVILITLTTE